MMAIITFIVACKQKKKASLSGNEPVEISDFIGFFQPTPLPYQFDARMMAKKEKDSFLISQKVFTQFVPDSVLTRVFGKASTIKMYPLGKVEASKNEKYLFVKAVLPKGSPSVAFILVFGGKNEFLSSLVAWRSDRDLGKSFQGTTVMDKKFTITKTRVRKNADGSVSEGKDTYAYSSDTKDFMLIMTDAMGDEITELINPLDTFSRKHKFSADYTNGKMNLVSIRDGRKTDRLRFFVHFEKSKGDCTGELKGEAMIRSANLAEYRQAGDPCVLQFRFTTSSVTLKELEGCGSHRGLRCAFDGIYPKKKEPKPKPAKKKSTAKKYWEHG